MNALNVLFPASNLFPGGKPDSTSFTAGNGGSGPSSNQFASEGIDSSQNSLTQALRSLSNFTGQQGMDTLGEGKKTTDSGKDLFSSGASDLEQPLNLYRALMSGDRASIESAIQPEKDQITKQFDQVRGMLSSTGARGGGRASTLAQLPFQQIQQISSLINSARMGAAQNEGALAATKAQLGLGEGSLGMSEQQLAEALLGLTNQNLLGRRGQNVQTDNANMGMLAGGLGQVLGAPLSDLTGVGLHKALF